MGVSVPRSICLWNLLRLASLQISALARSIRSCNRCSARLTWTMSSSSPARTRARFKPSTSRPRTDGAKDVPGAPELASTPARRAWLETRRNARHGQQDSDNSQPTSSQTSTNDAPDITPVTTPVQDTPRGCPWMPRQTRRQPSQVLSLTHPYHRQRSLSHRIPRLQPTTQLPCPLIQMLPPQPIQTLRPLRLKTQPRP